VNGERVVRTRFGKTDQLSQSGRVPQGRPASVRLCNKGFTDLHESDEKGKTAMAAIRDNKAQHRFELDVEGQVAFANYRETPQAVIITHTETPRALRGRGIASELVKGALGMIRADGHKVIAGCGFVVDYLGKHPEYRDLVA
jgi:predicted GNAT family acetyltransferase